jgi:hypothetical protein
MPMAEQGVGAAVRRPRARTGGRARWGPATAAFCLLAAAGPQAPAQVADKPDLRANLAQVGTEPRQRIVVLAPVVAEAASETPLLITLAPADALPKGSFLRLRGLPHSASLSEGHSIAPGSWAVPLNALPRLTLRLPAAVTGRSEMVISLIGDDGMPLSEVRVALVILPAETAKGARPAEPARPQVPALTPAERESAVKLVVRGEREFELGNIALARPFFLRAAQAGLARGALMLAATFDPREIARVGAIGVQPDLAEARRWYTRAVELGAPEAAERLARLGGS